MLWALLIFFIFEGGEEGTGKVADGGFCTFVVHFDGILCRQREHETCKNDCQWILFILRVVFSFNKVNTSLKQSSRLFFGIADEPVEGESQFFGLIIDMLFHERGDTGAIHAVNASFVEVESAVETFAVLVIILSQRE